MKLFVIVVYFLTTGGSGTWTRYEFPYATFSSLEVCNSMKDMVKPTTAKTSAVICEEKR